ncbi:8-amino-7-oxononanoate synthase [Paenibacillus silvae]|uniref:8-amino-7-oxononanoate synthase n=1 Tax=Paenibacillus silvae TaxID=1325358 RepID=UPI0025A2F234|nr:8-amino-7-oxononanoate synthase [Paenibacillus silvae]MDM5279907.1 8-amino-7-oxononanoate synthase [Paenibacillus silvae]
MNWMENELEKLAHASNQRHLRDSTKSPERPGHIVRGGNSLLDLASNNYLGLAGHPDIIQAICETLQVEGAGSGASRFVTGNRSLYGRLEAALASWQHAEASLVFANGYMANSGVIAALMGRGDVVFSDQYNHASIVDGVVLSRAEHARYRHNDLEHLEALLHKHRDKRRKLIVTDALFSMDGDRARLHELVKLKRRYDAMLMVDEAHSGGVYGEKGEGLCHELGLHRHVDVHIGTFSKAFGIYGAYITGNNVLIQFLMNKVRPLIYSTALPPSLLAGIMTALHLVQTEHWRRNHLRSASDWFRSALMNAGFYVVEGDSQVVPIMVGDSEQALRFSEALEGVGIAGIAIRPPTVPVGTARIRFSVSSAHTYDELRQASVLIKKVGNQLGLLTS